MKYNFDEIIDRSGTSATKMESLPKGCPDDALPLWVADMDFACAEPILKALHERIEQKDLRLHHVRHRRVPGRSPELV